MTEWSSPIQQIEEPPSFNLLEAMFGVMADPGFAMRQIAQHRPWVAAWLLTAAISLINWLAFLTADWAGQIKVLPAEIVPAIEWIRAVFHSPITIAVVSLIVAPLFLAIATLFYYGVSSLVGGDGSFTGLFSTLAFAGLPGFFLGVTVGLLNAVGAGEGSVAGWATSIFNLWSLILSVLAIRGTFGFSLAKSCLIYLIPVIMFFLTFVAIIIWLVYEIAAMISGGSASGGFYAR